VLKSVCSFELSLVARQESLRCRELLVWLCSCNFHAVNNMPQVRPVYYCLPSHFSFYSLVPSLAKICRLMEVSLLNRGLGEIICLKFAQEGSNVAINYMSSSDSAQALSEKIKKDYGVKAVLIQGVSSFSLSKIMLSNLTKDMGKEADVTNSVKETISKLGGLDVIISNAGYTRFSTFNDLNAPTVEDWDTCFAVNVKAQSYLLREAKPTFDANTEGGVLIITSSIAGIKTSGSSMPYSVTKAAQLHLMKCLASTQGPKVRVNAVLPGILLTEWVSLAENRTYF
jgi:NAD(P)-dependent dehydrogenase (short-subunit alcohol dehydrogenase family)